MYYGLKGRIEYLTNDSIILNVNNVYYEIIRSTTYDYKLNEDVMIFIVEHRREDNLSLIGFHSPNEKEMFLKLMSVQGIGPKTSSAILRTCHLEILKCSIASGDINFLCSLPLLSKRCAEQLILELKNKMILETKNTNENYLKMNNVIKALKEFGYRKQDYGPLIMKFHQYDLETGVIIKMMVEELTTLYGN